MKKNRARRISGIMALVALVLGCAILTAPLRAGASETGTEKRPVWTATEADIARQAAEGVLLKDIINNAWKSGESIQEIVAAAIKVGIDPSRVVVTSIAEGYAAQTVVKAAMKADAFRYAAVSSAANAEADKKSLYIKEVLAAAIQVEVDPYLAVYTAISEGYPVQTVVSAALKAGAPLNVVVRSAIDAGSDKKSVYVGAADAGASPREVERALSAAKIQGASIPPTAAAPPTHSPVPAIFGRGGIVLSQSPAWAPPTLPLGPLKLNPFLGLSETFSDNVLFTADNRKRDLITTITPGVRVELPFQAHSAELEYYSVITRYGYKYRGEDISDHHVNAAVDLKFDDRFGIQLSDRLARDHEPRSSSATGDLEVFHTNAANASATYQPTDNFTVRLDYGKSTWRFITSHFRDREEDQLAGAVFYRVLPQASLFIEYGQRNIAYAEKTLDLDSTVGTMQAGVTWDFTERSKGTLKAGLARKDFTSSTRSNGTVKVGSADVRHDFTSDTTIVLTAQRSMNEPDITGSNYFISFGGFAELTQRFMQRFAATVRWAYVQDLYFVRTDRTALSGAGLKYQAAKWLEFAVDYNRHKRQSNIQVNDYTEQSSIITMNVSL